MTDFFGVKNNLSKVKDLFRDLLRILESEGDSETLYARRELFKNIRIIEDALHHDPNPADLHAIFTEVKESYQRMYPPRDGLTEFFIWRDDFDERLKANEPLDSIKERLKAILNG